jgi:hypothetical protein
MATRLYVNTNNVDVLERCAGVPTGTYARLKNTRFVYCYTRKGKEYWLMPWSSLPVVMPSRRVQPCFAQLSNGHVWDLSRPEYSQEWEDAEQKLYELISDDVALGHMDAFLSCGFHRFQADDAVLEAAGLEYSCGATTNRQLMHEFLCKQGNYVDGLYCNWPMWETTGDNYDYTFIRITGCGEFHFRLSELEGLSWS